MSRFAAPISDQIWKMKYQMKEFDGTPIDHTVEDSWRRISKNLASVEKFPSHWEEEFYNALEDFKFLPAGRITAGAGTDRNVTLFNCYVMGIVPDSMDGIFTMLKEAALTMQQGGGIGYDFSTIRPKGTEVKGVAADASGPLSFMDVWDATCKTVMSAGSRRGAMMATMRCDHPDVLEFVHAKKEANRLRMFNLSVLITDKFMEAIKADADFDLVFEGKVYKTVRAVDVWNAIIQSTYDQAEPGVIFIDRINQMNNLGYCETIASTNPCGEQPLPPYGACLLGSINLARLIVDPFTESAHMDLEALEKLVKIAIRMMDNVIDVSKFPLPQQEKEAKAKRRIGLGVTGLADALAMVKVVYGSEEATRITDNWMRMIAVDSYEASIDLAKEKGSFPLLDAKQFNQSGNMQNMYVHIRADVETHGIRNALLTSIAPTGTISLYAGNISSGVEPIFAYSYNRKVLQKDGSRTTELVEDYAVAEYRKFWETRNDEVFDLVKHLPDYFVNAQTLTPSDHIRMQSAAQRWIDSSISKTINCPEDISFEDFKEVYMEAWNSGCKGCTTYRPNEITGSVLSVESDKKKEEVTETQEAFDINENLPDRPNILRGSTYKIRWPHSNHAIYITINDRIDERGVASPFEIFINSKNTEHFAWTVALTRMISAVFRRGGNVDFVAEELRAVFDPTGGAFMGGKYQPSMIAAIGSEIQKHLEMLKGENNPEEVIQIEVTSESKITQTGQIPKQCPSCNEYSMITTQGCPTCLDCGWSKCS